MQTFLNDGYCPECQLNDEDIALQLNRDDFWECPKSHLQLAVYGINAVVLKFRGVAQFRNEITKGPDHIDGAILTGAKNDTILSNDVLFNSETEFRDYLENEVEAKLEFTLQNLVDTYTNYKFGNPFTFENSSLPYKRQSKHFKIDFENKNILKKLEVRDAEELVPYNRSYLHLYRLLSSLFEKYYEANMDWLPEMGMSQIEFEFCKKHLPNAEMQEFNSKPSLVKRRLQAFIVDLTKVIYQNETPVTNPYFAFINQIKGYKENNNFVLKAEQNAIQEFNETVSETYKIHTEIMPSPYMGNVETAPIVLLTLNPGFDKKEVEKGFHGKYNHWLEKELVHEHINPELPLFNLDESYREDSSYWFNKLKPLHQRYGIKAVADKVCKIQYFPYTSQKFRKISSRLLSKEIGLEYLPSQLYNFWLVEKAIERNAVIILTRSKDLWFKAVPALKNYQNIYFTNSSQNITISPKNCPEAFPVMEEILSGKQEAITAKF